MKITAHVSQSNYMTQILPPTMRTGKSYYLLLEIETSNFLLHVISKSTVKAIIFKL